MSHFAPAVNGGIITRNTNIVELAIGSTGQVLTVSGGLPAWAAPASSGPSLAKVTSDLSPYSSATLTDTTGLEFSVTSGRFYAFQFFVAFSMATATGGLKVGITGPANNILVARVSIPQLADGLGSEFAGQISSSGDSVDATANPAGSTDFIAIASGVINPTANGTLRARHAVTGGADTVTIRRGSAGVLFDLGT